MYHRPTQSGHPLVGSGSCLISECADDAKPKASAAASVCIIDQLSLAIPLWGVGMVWWCQAYSFGSSECMYHRPTQPGHPPPPCGEWEWCDDIEYWRPASMAWHHWGSGSGQIIGSALMIKMVNVTFLPYESLGGVLISLMKSATLSSSLALVLRNLLS